MFFVLLFMLAQDGKSLITTPLDHISGRIAATSASDGHSLLFTNVRTSKGNPIPIYEFYVCQTPNYDFQMINDGRINQKYNFAGRLGNQFVLYAVMSNDLCVLDENFLFQSSSLAIDYLNLDNELNAKMVYISPYLEGKSLVTLRSGSQFHVGIFSDHKTQVVGSYQSPNDYQSITWVSVQGEVFMIMGEQDEIYRCNKSFQPETRIYKGQGPAEKNYSPDMRKIMLARGASPFKSKINGPIVSSDHFSALAINDLDGQGEPLKKVERRFLYVDTRGVRYSPKMQRAVGRVGDRQLIFDNDDGIFFWATE